MGEHKIHTPTCHTALPHIRAQALAYSNNAPSVRPSVSQSLSQQTLGGRVNAINSRIRSSVKRATKKTIAAATTTSPMAD